MSLALLGGLRSQHFLASCCTVRRCSSDWDLLWLWYKSAAAALIQPLAWELPFEVVKRKKKKLHLGVVAKKGT